MKEAVEELKNEEFTDVYNENSVVLPGERETFVSDCTIESDMELLFPNSYIPNDSERISLYQELDNMERASDIQAFSAKLEDRFGRIPHEGKELIRIVTLRQLAKQLGMEKVVLKQEKMNLFFVSDNNIRYFQSPVFGKVLSYLQKNPRQCQLREIKGKRSIYITHIKTVEEAVLTLQNILEQEEL